MEVKSVLLVVLFLFSSFCLFKKNKISFEFEGGKKNEILWKKDVKLNWGNFQGIPDSLSDYKASTFSRIGFKCVEQDLFINIDFSSYFSKDQSWTKNPESKSLLSHEQLHFDITELIARKIRRECKDVKTEKELFNNAIELLKVVYDKNYKIKDSINLHYDSETEHGAIIEKQLEWEKKIALELKGLSKFTSPIIMKRFLR